MAANARPSQATRPPRDGRAVGSPSRSRRARTIAAFGERLLRVLRRIVLGFVLFSVGQVLLARYVAPFTTFTILGRRIEALRAGQPFHVERQNVRRAAISDEIVRAVLAGEDDRFYEHHGFDWKEIRAAWAYNHRPENQRRGRVHGASTLTQQTARNVFLWQDRSWLRKGLEAWYTVLLEVFVPKDRILELYLDVAELGDGVFGVEAAAQHDFHVPAQRITRVQAAALASSLPFPRRYPPTSNARPRRKRQEIILRRMEHIHPGESPRVEVDLEAD